MLTNLRYRLAKQAVNSKFVSAPTRGIKLHEYQAGALLNAYKVAIPIGEVVHEAEDAYNVAKKFEGGCVVKSQILGGGRGMGYFKENNF